MGDIPIPIEGTRHRIGVRELEEAGSSLGLAQIIPSNGQTHLAGRIYGGLPLVRPVSGSG